MTEYAIEARGLAKSFGEVQAVRGLDLEVPEGSLFGLLGANGAGKTTTIRMLLGLVSPTAGTATILGRDAIREGEEVRLRIGYLPESRSMYEYMSVAELIRFSRSFYPSWDSALVDRYMDLFGLSPDRKVGALSNGMRTQLGLVLALGPRPDLLILDEPTSGLDPIASRHFLQVILEESTQQGQTVLMSSHMLYQVERVADRVGIMDAGRLVISRPIDELKLGEKKIAVAFQKSPPEELFELPGVVRVEREGRRCVFHVSDHVEEIVEAVRKVPHFTVEVIDLNLEDIFIRYAEKGDVTP